MHILQIYNKLIKYIYRISLKPASYFLQTCKNPKSGTRIESYFIITLKYKNK